MYDGSTMCFAAAALWYVFLLSLYSYVPKAHANLTGTNVLLASSSRPTSTSSMLLLSSLKGKLLLSLLCYFSDLCLQSLHGHDLLESCRGTGQGQKGVDPLRTRHVTFISHNLIPLYLALTASTPLLHNCIYHHTQFTFLFFWFPLSSLH